MQSSNYFFISVFSFYRTNTEKHNKQTNVKNDQKLQITPSKRDRSSTKKKQDDVKPKKNKVTFM